MLKSFASRKRRLTTSTPSKGSFAAKKAKVASTSDLPKNAREPKTVSKPKDSPEQIKAKASLAALKARKKGITPTLKTYTSAKKPRTDASYHNLSIDVKSLLSNESNAEFKDTMASMLGVGVLPCNYAALEDTFEGLITSLTFVSSRRKDSCFVLVEDLATMVKRISKREFNEDRLAQMVYLLPEVFDLHLVPRGSKKHLAMNLLDSSKEFRFTSATSLPLVRLFNNRLWQCYKKQKASFLDSSRSKVFPGSMAVVPRSVLPQEEICSKETFLESFEKQCVLPMMPKTISHEALHGSIPKELADIDPELVAAVRQQQSELKWRESVLGDAHTQHLKSLLALLPKTATDIKK